MFSSIPEHERITVINNCYWPLLELVQSGIPIGIECSGVTLEIINNLEPRWINEFKQLCLAKKCELIGSGYAQIIGPLVPAQVNQANQTLGIQTYQKILGIHPTIALINEMAYSSGVLEHYIQQDYQAVIMEWNNPRMFHKEWPAETRFYPQVLSSAGQRLPLLWADSIIFQKIQRFVHQEDTEEETFDYFSSLESVDDGCLPFYANDAEIYGFRPGRYQTEAIYSNEEWQQLKTLFHKTSSQLNFQHKLPSEILAFYAESLKTKTAIFLESPEQPIPVKKQEKYNINRWALTGRNDLYINTMCYRLLKNINEAGKPTDKDLKQSCYFWSSDFRTHIETNRWKTFCHDLSHLNLKDQTNIPLNSSSQSISHQNKKYITLENSSLQIKFNLYKGLSIDQFILKNYSNTPLFGTLTHGFYDDISLGADFFSGHSLICQPGKHKLTNLHKSDADYFKQDSSQVIQSSFSHSSGTDFKTCHELTEQSLILNQTIELSRRNIQTIHPFILTFCPKQWDIDSLFFMAHNGGTNYEKFYFKSKTIQHTELLSPLISAKHGLGATEGKIIVGDKAKALEFYHYPDKCALIPSFIFRQVNDNTFFLRLIYSAQEMDETFVENDHAEQIIGKLKITQSRVE
ncbi:MAG: hypothetical protein HON94_05870 [Methylococcales bacterium]|jgi:hypothetical protein|nr:hypothetical protein [Methylococcales bacterium]